MTDTTHRTSERRDVRRNREAVIDAAIAVFADAPEASMAEVAAASGVGRSTVYRHFPDRDHLLRALYRRVVEDAHAIVSRHVGASRASGDDDIPGTLVAMVLELGGLGDRFRFLDGRREEAEELRAVIAEVGPEPLASFLELGRVNGQLSAALTTDWMTEVLHHLTHLAALQLQAGSPSPAEIERMLGLTVRGALGAGRPDGRAPAAPRG